MQRMNRRVFLRTSLTTAAGAAAWAGRSGTTWAQVEGANGDVRVAVVGLRGKGHGHVGQFRKLKGVRVTALCDADTEFLDREVRAFTDRGEKVDPYTDVRKLLESRNVDAVVIATPNHWHALISIWACQAGKDVYVEKPVSHNVWEGRRIVEAARRYNRIVQAGTQRRSDPGLAEAWAYLKEGHLGRVLCSRGFCYKRRESIGKVAGPQKPPATVDYDLWTGPAPLVPLMRKNLHYDWHWVWPTGNGDLGNQGIHEMDVCRWAIGAPAVSPAVMSVGGRFGYDDDGETPNTLFVIHDYRPAPILFEVRGLPAAPNASHMDNYRGIRIGNVVECEGGYVAGGWAYDKEGKKVRQFGLDEGGGHAENFIQAVRSRRREDLNADILEGHLSSALCHTGNISYRLGEEAAPGEVAERLKGDAAAMETFERFREHLSVNGVRIDERRAVLGPRLAMDPAAERFTGERAERANALLTREYRKPFAVPEKV